MINYILGVQWTDSFRFTTKVKETEEGKKSNWISVYSIRPEQGSRLQHRLNIIDVLSFDASKPLTDNLGLVEQVRVLLAESAPLGLDYLDAVCFIVRSTDSKMSKFQDVMLQHILSSFGKDLQENKFVALPFSDKTDPPIVQCFRKTDLPFRKTFKFNSSALFLANVGLKPATTLPLFWDAANDSFAIFFEELGKTNVQGLLQTKTVIEQHTMLKKYFKIIRKKVDTVLKKANELNTEQNKIVHEEDVIKDNASFKTVVEETASAFNELTSGSYAVNCTECKVTCCTNVASQADEIEKCDAIDSSGRCKVCPNKYLPQSHQIESNIYKITKKPVTKIDRTKKDACDNAELELQRLEHRVDIMSHQMNVLCDALQNESETVSSQQIKENSLWPHVTGFENEIDLSIEMEKEERQEGFIARIRAMKEFRKYLEITNDVDRFAQDAKSILSVVGRNRRENKDALFNLTRFSTLFSHLHAE